MFSLAKPFIAAAIYHLEIDHLAYVSNWVDKQTLPHGETIRIRQLLQHTSGLRDYASHPEYIAAIARREPPWSDDAFAARTLQQPLLHDATKDRPTFAYSNAGYWLLTRVICAETNLELGAALKALVFEPLRMLDTHRAEGIFAEDVAEYPAEWVWHGLFLSTPTDCVRFMHSPIAAKLASNPLDTQERHPAWHRPHYAHGMMVEPDSCYGHLGGGPNYGAACLHFLDSGITGCVLGRGSEQECLADLREAAMLNRTP